MSISRRHLIGTTTAITLGTSAMAQAQPGLPKPPPYYTPIAERIGREVTWLNGDGSAILGLRVTDVRIDAELDATIVTIRLAPHNYLNDDLVFDPAALLLVDTLGQGARLAEVIPVREDRLVDQGVLVNAHSLTTCSVVFRIPADRESVMLAWQPQMETILVMLLQPDDNPWH